MLNIISERTPTEYVEHYIEFTDDNGSGFSFPCTPEGTPVFASKDAENNYKYAIQHPEKFPVQFNEFTRRVQHYTQPAKGICRCGTEVELYDQYQGACSCPKCGQWYNLFGQELIPPEYWEPDGEDW